MWCCQKKALIYNLHVRFQSHGSLNVTSELLLYKLLRFLAVILPWTETLQPNPTYTRDAGGKFQD